MAKFSFIDLFAGIGGFRLALESVGGECLGFSEIAPDAIKTYCTNFDEDISANFGDITKIKDLPQHDFMTAGVPCQSWSIAGKNLGFDDDRGQLWNDTLFLLNKVRPKAFIFENVKGLADPRNEEALNYILDHIKQAGYYAQKYVLNAYNYGVPQTRVRIYIVGFRDKKFADQFVLPEPFPGRVRLCDVLDDWNSEMGNYKKEKKARWSLSCNDMGFNDYFLFNDLRNGNTTIHSWDIIETTEREKHICYLLLSNRRKKEFGALDGNPLSLEHFQSLDATITKNELESLVRKKILKHVDYLFELCNRDLPLTEAEQLVLSTSGGKYLNVDLLKTNRLLKTKKINVQETLAGLLERNIIRCVEIRYDFKNTKISTGLNGINRIFLPSSKIYPTLVASDTNDFVATRPCTASSIEQLRETFMESIYRSDNFRKITKSEACRIQGFPADYQLPPTRPRWMKLIGNSVAVPVIKMLAEAIVKTRVFEGCETKTKTRIKQLDLFEVAKQYPDTIVVNKPEKAIACKMEYPKAEVTTSARGIDMQGVDISKNVLISLVKADNMEQYLDGSAKIYYTGKKFPSTVHLNKLYYFMPYLKSKGIRDLYFIKVARVGTKAEVHPECGDNDFRLVFEIEFVKQLLPEYTKVKLPIWETFNDTTMEKLATMSAVK